jgi:pimeloyl-ACP methyl ester carboxylesterase
VENGTGYRILYLSQLGNGKKVVSSGLIFVPKSQSTHHIVAWAHGTIGMGDQCAPSRNPSEISFLNWVPTMLARGWTVTATDYYGLGTPGTERYLIGNDQARDVLNSVRAAKQFDPQTTSDYVLFGHSQGGQAALFASQLAPQYLPEFQLKGTTIGAPATLLPAIMDQQYDKPITWIVGPEMAQAWPQVYSQINLPTSLSKQGFMAYHAIANNCIDQELAQAVIRTTLKITFFKENPVRIPSWNEAMKHESPPSPPKDLPVLIVQSLSDNVVLPNVTALYIQNSCKNSSHISTIWLQKTSHVNTPKAAAPQIMSWMNSVFQGKTVPNDCKKPLPIHPYVSGRAI